MNNNRKRFGAYLFDAPSNVDSVKQFEKLIGRKLDIVAIYEAWDSKQTNIEVCRLNKLHSQGWIPLITWEPWCISAQGSCNKTAFSLDRILAGDYDGYIEKCATVMAELAYPVFIRPMHEMNGNWYPWCGLVGGNTPNRCKAVWRYLHRVFETRGAKVKWVWSPYAQSYPAVPKNELTSYYPGDAYVDWLAIDGYNWGVGSEGHGWQTFEEIFTQAYKTILEIADKPIMIAETACAESGGDKAKWISDAFLALESRFDRIQILIWFNTLKERDWRIDSSPSALSAFKLALKSFS